jgi:hypothetical protein
MNDLTNEQLINHVSPGSNTGDYFIAHLVKLNEALLPLLGIGEKLYPDRKRILKAIMVNRALINLP